MPGTVVITKAPVGTTVTSGGHAQPPAATLSLTTGSDDDRTQKRGHLRLVPDCDS